MADFDFSTIVYLILIALVSIFGGRKKKRQNREPSPASGNSPKPTQAEKSPVYNFFEQLEKNLVDPDPVVAQKPASDANPYMKYLKDFDETEELEIETGSSGMSFSDGQGNFEKQRDYTNYFDDNKKLLDYDAIMDEARSRSLFENEKKVVKRKLKLDLRKAVVYSEILKRPYA